MRERERAVVVLVSFVAGVALLSAGSAPPLRSWSGLEAWYLEHGAATAVIALIRAVGLGACTWVVLAGSLQVVASVVGNRGFALVVDRVSPRFLRLVRTTAAGLSVSAGLALPVLPAGPGDDPPGTAVMVPLDATSTTTSTTATSTPSSTSTTTTRPPSDPPATIPAVPERPAPPATPAPAPDPAAPMVAPDEVVVARGDSFWSIAVEEAGEQEVDEYWRALIELNRHRLVDPTNPDLLYRGQVLRLP